MRSCPEINGSLIEDPKSGLQLAAALEPLLETAYRERLAAQTPASVAEYRWPVVLQRYARVLLENCR